MDSVTIREATFADVEDILRIAEQGWNEAYSGILSQETIDTAMTEWYGADNTREIVEREDAVYFVAERNGEIIGYVSGGPSNKKNVANLGAIYVDPNHWGKGTGTALLETFEDYCRREDYDRIRFRVLSENDVGTSFYRKHGYNVIDEQETNLFDELVRECIYSGPTSDNTDCT